MKIYRTDERAPEWMQKSWMQKSWMPKYAPKGNCPQCRGEIRVAREGGGGSVWRCTSCRVELVVDNDGAVLSARNIQPWHLGPPDILCSKCGESLVKASRGYRCQPCGREVRA